MLLERAQHDRAVAAKVDVRLPDLLDARGLDRAYDAIGFVEVAL